MGVIKMTILLVGYEKPNTQILFLQVNANPFLELL